MRQLSNQELLWCRMIARKIRHAHEKYRHACSVLNGSRSVVVVGSGSPPAKNRVEWAHVWKATWEQFTDHLTPKQKELTAEIIDYERNHFSRGEKYILCDIDRIARKMGLW